MNPTVVKRSLVIVLSVATLATCFVCLVVKISDPDFFWHLKTGELIWQHRSLPAEDPFSYTSPDHEDRREHFILTGFWLSEVIFYLFYAGGGMWGIVVLRFILIGILIVVMLKRRRGDSLLYMGLLLMFLASILKTFPVERPQVFSFLFFALQLLLLENVRDDTSYNKGKWIYFFFPLLMLTWANTHPGFVLGLTAIAVYIIMEGIKFLHPTLSPTSRGAYKRLALIGASGIVVSLLNPNAYHAFVELNQPAFHTSANIEYLSTFSSFRMFSAYGLVLYWLALLLTISGFIIHMRKVDITELVLLAGTGYFSFTTMRYVPLFLVAALPAVSRAFSGGRFLKPVRIFIIAVSLFAGTFLSWNGRANLDNLTSGDWINRYLYPVTGAEFIMKNELKGNMYNPDYWGGYLMWKLAPERKVFIDGRTLDFTVYKEYLLIDAAAPTAIAGIPAWKAMLEAYNVKYVVTPFSRYEGGLVGLLYALLNDRDWLPVFADHNSVIFVKDLPIHSDVVKKYAISKDHLILHFFDTCNRQIAANPNNIAAHITEGDLFMTLSNVYEARKAYEKALQIMPFNAIAAERLKRLDTKSSHEPTLS
jgi:hypothetical protein